jgi:hypothetical protein
MPSPMACGIAGKGLFSWRSAHSGRWRLGLGRAGLANGRAASGGLQVITFQQATQALRAKYFLGAGWLLRNRWFITFGKWHVANSLVRAVAVVAGLHEFADEVLEMGFAEHDEMVEALRFDGEHKALGKGIEHGLARPDGNGLDTCPLKSGVEIGAELAVKVTDQVSCLDGLLSRVEGEVLAGKRGHRTF